MDSEVGGTVECHRSKPPRKETFAPARPFGGSSITRPHAKLPSWSGIDQKSPGRSLLLDFGVKGYGQFMVVANFEVGALTQARGRPAA